MLFLLYVIVDNEELNQSIANDFMMYFLITVQAVSVLQEIPKISSHSQRLHP